MKKFKLITAIAAVTAIASNILAPVNAAKIIMNGTTENALGVTVLIADKTADVNNLKPNEIFWIDQQNVKSDGSFSIVLPAYDSSLYNMYTNSKNPVYGEAKSKTVYVSSNGTGTGETADAPTTIDDAISNIEMIKEIILVDNVTLSGNLPADVTIKGSSATVELTLDSTVALSGSLRLDNLKLTTGSLIYANGFSFEVTDTVTSTNRLNVYGGAYNKAVASTDLKLYGGKYQYIYGGGNGGTVTGDTNVIVGGNVNDGDSIDDNSPSKSPCYVYGGGYNAPVNGKTNVTLDGKAVALYLVGAGAATNGTAKDTNIFIKGGKAMNVYAGSTNVALPSGVNTHVTITGGMVEAIFGGCESVAMTGNTYVNLLGGEVTRRVYTGCYNDVDFSRSGLSVVETWKSSNYVNGTTTLSIAPEIKLNTKTELDSDNSVNVGVFAGSRINDDLFSTISETNTIIYLDGSYSTKKSAIGEKSYYLIVSLSNWLKSNEKYVVKASTGGKVYGTATGGQVKIVPDSGKVAKIDSADKAYFANDNATITGTHDVKFVDSITAEAKKDSTGVSGEANIRKEGSLVAAIYDSTGKFVACDNVSYDATTDCYKINIDHVLDQGNTYTVKVFLWDSLDGMSPLMNVYSVKVQ